MDRSLQANLADDLQHKAADATAAISDVGGTPYLNQSELADPGWANVSLFAATSSGTVILTNSVSQSVLPNRSAMNMAMSGHAAFATVGSGRNAFVVYSQPIYQPPGGRSAVLGCRRGPGGAVAADRVRRHDRADDAAAGGLGAGPDAGVLRRPVAGGPDPAADPREPAAAEAVRQRRLSRAAHAGDRDPHRGRGDPAAAPAGRRARPSAGRGHRLRERSAGQPGR